MGGEPLETFEHPKRAVCPAPRAPRPAPRAPRPAPRAPRPRAPRPAPRAPRPAPRAPRPAPRAPRPAPRALRPAPRAVPRAECAVLGGPRCAPRAAPARARTAAGRGVTRARRARALWAQVYILGSEDNGVPSSVLKARRPPPAACRSPQRRASPSRPACTGDARRSDAPPLTRARAAGGGRRRATRRCRYRRCGIPPSTSPSRAASSCTTASPSRRAPLPTGEGALLPCRASTRSASPRGLSASPLRTPAPHRTPAPPPPPPPRTKWTRRVPHPVLIGHAASLTPY